MFLKVRLVRKSGILEDLYKKNQMAVESLSKGITPNLNISMMHNDIQKSNSKRLVAN